MQHLKFIFIILTALSTQTAIADIPSELEPRFAEAVMSYRNNQPDQSLKALESLIESAPQSLEFLELKALVLKSLKNDKAAAITYSTLIKNKVELKAPKSEIAPYYFELGLIRFREKDFRRAQENLEIAQASNFNPGPTAYFLGMILFQQGNLDQAVTQFQTVLRAGITELAPVSYFFLAQVHLKASFPQGAIENFTQARDSAQAILERKDSPDSSKETATQILNASKKALETLDRNSWFGSASLQGGYDTNVLSYPTSIVGSAATGKATSRLNYQLGIGYATSPTRAFQWVPSYKMIGNYNFNRDSRSGEYVTQILSLSGIRRPLERTVIGIKLDIPVTFQNQPDTAASGTKYRALSLGGSIGPTLKRVFSPKFSGVLENTWGYLRYPGDSKLTTDTLKRSGLSVSNRLLFNWDRGDAWLNPGISALYSWTSTKGTEYRVRQLGSTFLNSMNLFEKVRLNQSISFTSSQYSARLPTVRKDTTWVGAAGASWTLSKKWTAVADTTYTLNDSNEKTTYKYNRFTIAAGMNYNIF